ncbi:MAG: hypothetical protein COT22_12805, partial [Ignavibacteria bacterium CG08_land_8_20_14_0_20_37_9]
MKIFLLHIFVFAITCFGQTDSLKVFSTDSSKVLQDSLALHDSTKKSTDIDSIIYSSAKDSIIFFLDQKKMHLYGSGDMR